MQQIDFFPTFAGGTLGMGGRSRQRGPLRNFNGFLFCSLADAVNQDDTI